MNCNLRVFSLQSQVHNDEVVAVFFRKRFTGPDAFVIGPDGCFDACARPNVHRTQLTVSFEIGLYTSYDFDEHSSPTKPIRRGKERKLENE